MRPGEYRRGFGHGSDVDDDDDSEKEDECKYETDLEVNVHPGFNARDTTVAVDVGKSNPTRFHIHKTILNSTSRFLKAKVKPEWLEEHGSIKLEDHSAAAFDVYTKWLYYQDIPSTVSNNGDEEQHAAEFRLSAAAFVLGEVLLDDEFKNAVMDFLNEKVRGPHGNAFFLAAADMANVIYEGNSRGLSSTQVPGECLQVLR